MIKVDNIEKSYGAVKAVNGLSFEVKDGEIFGLLGENGAGKTTTFRIIMGLLETDKGEVSLDGKKIDYNITDKIGFLTEERSLLTKMTVKEQIIYYGILKGMKEKQILDRLSELLKEFEIEDYLNRKIKELSKGNQQKIQFIASVINSPRLLILDEPFTGLDPINVELFKNYIRKLQKSGCSIIFSSHQLEHIEEFCEKLTILVKGKSILNGYVKDIKKEYQKQNIFIKGDVDIKEIEKIKGVIKVTKTLEEVLVKITDDSVINKVFKEISNKSITKFSVEEATLNEIFIEKVREQKC